MDIALVEHAENDIDRKQRSGDQHRLVGERLLKDLGGALKAPWIEAGMPSWRISSSIAAVAWLSETSGAKLNEIVEATKRFW